MQNKKILLFLMVIVLIGFNIVIIINTIRKNKQISICTDSLHKSNQKIETRLNYFLEREYKCVESENFRLSGQIILNGLDGSSHLLSEQINRSPTLFFRFFGSNCQTCIDVEIERIVQYLSNINPDKLAILVSDKDIHALSYFKKVNKIKFKIFLVEKDQILIPMEKYNIPYLFVLGADGLTNSVFIPEKNEDRFSKQYYNLITNILNNE